MRALTALGLIVALAACQPAAVPPAVSGAAGQARVLWGRAAAGWGIQAVEGDLKPFGTVSLLDAGNNVVASGTTDAAGAFRLNPFVTWTPTTNAVYALDLSKRFETANEGALLRLRTLVSWNGTQWTSISGTTASLSGGGGVLVNAGTTAVAAIQGLRGLTASAMLGSVEPTTGTFIPGSTGIPTADFTTVRGLVGNALAANLDPVRAITWSSTTSTYGARLETLPGRLLFDLEDTPPTPGFNPSPVRTRFGAGIAVASEAAISLGQFGGYGSSFGNLEAPGGIGVDPFGNVYVGNFQGNHRVVKYDPNGTYLYSIGQPGTGTTQFSQPNAYVDPQGNLWVAEGGNHRIQKFDANGTFQFGIGQGTVWGVAPAPTAGTANGWINYPHFLKTDRVGNLWLTEWTNHRIQVFAPNGAFLRGIGNGTTWTGAAPAPVAGSGAGYFNGPAGLAFDPQGNVWVCDRINHRIQKFDANGNFLAAYGSNGTGNGQFSSPQDIVIDAAGNLWIDELDSHRVQKFDSNFNYLGKIGSPGSGRGQLSTPEGMAIDRDGNLLVAEMGTKRIQRFAPASPGLSYSTNGRINLAAGTIEMWIRPSWAGTAPGVQRLLQFYQNPAGIGNGIGILKNGSTLAADLWPNAASGHSIGADISSWQPNTEHHLAYTWSTTELAFYVDGRLAGTKAPSGQMAVLPSTMDIGHAGGFEVANTLFESIRIYDYPKSRAEIMRDYALNEQN